MNKTISLEDGRNLLSTIAQANREILRTIVYYRTMAYSRNYAKVCGMLNDLGYTLNEAHDYTHSLLVEVDEKGHLVR